MGLKLVILKKLVEEMREEAGHFKAFDEIRIENALAETTQTRITSFVRH